MPMKVIQKAWQLERAYRILDKELDGAKVAAVVILTNGELSSFWDHAHNLGTKMVQLKTKLCSKDIPFILGYTPY